MVSFKLLFPFLGAVSAAPSTFGGAAAFEQVQKDIDDIDSNVRNLIDQLKGYHSGDDKKPLLESFAGIEKALTAGDIHSALLSPLTPEQAREIIEHVNSTLTVDNQMAVDLAISKRPEFQKEAVDLFFVPAFAALEVGHEAFTINVGLKIPPQLLEKGSSVTSPISKALLKGIAAFSGLVPPS